MRTVYRVEHKDHGHGPYLRPDEDGDNDVHYEIAGLHDAHEGSTAHPGPRGDGLSWELSRHHVHGFDSRAKLDRWFTGFKRKLHAAGYVIRVFEALDESTYTSDSGRQTIFVKAEAKVVDTMSVVR